MWLEEVDTAWRRGYIWREVEMCIGGQGPVPSIRYSRELSFCSRTEESLPQMLEQLMCFQAHAQFKRMAGLCWKMTESIFVDNDDVIP